MIRDLPNDEQPIEEANLERSVNRDDGEAARRAPITRFDLIAIALIVVAATLVMLPLFLHGFAAGDDSVMHFRRAADFIEALGEGAIYPRWLPRSNYGQGSPVMLYYPPLPYYVVAAFDSLVSNPLLSLKLGCWFALALSGVTMYVFARSLFSRWVSLLAALLYLTASYHLFDVYHRAALSEYWSFAWLPLVLDATLRVASGRGWRAAAYLSISYALLLLTHVTISFELTLLLPVFLLLLTRDLRRIVQAGAGLALGAAMSAIFLVPLQTEISYVRIDRALRIHYVDFFLFQNLRGAFSKHVFPPPEQRRFYLLDGIDLMAVGITLLLAVSAFVIWRNRRVIQASAPGWGLARSAFAIAALSLLLTTRLSAPVWRLVPQFAYIQHPFRWLVVATLGAVLLSGIAASALNGAAVRSKQYTIAFALAVAFNIAISGFVVAKASYDPAEALEERRSVSEVSEYRTVWLDRQKNLDDFTKPAASIVSGEATVTAIDESGARQSYLIDAPDASTIKLRTLYFPGWVARVDGALTEIKPSTEGNIQFSVEPGSHTLSLSFEDTWPRKAGKLVSAAGVLVLIVMLFATSGVAPLRSSASPAVKIREN